MNFSSREIVIDPTAWDFMHVAKHLPLTWNGRRVDTEAKLQWRFSRTAARHEAMHVLFSVPPECDGILHYLVNALEDEWMEQIARFFYPAAWGDFVTRARLITKYYPLPSPETLDRGSLMLNRCLYHCWDWKLADALFLAGETCYPLLSSLCKVAKPLHRETSLSCFT